MQYFPFRQNVFVSSFFLFLCCCCSLFAEDSVLGAGEGGNLEFFSQDLFLGVWRVEALADAENREAFTFILKPGGLASRVHENGAIVQGKWSIVQSPVEDLLIDTMLVVSWEQGGYSFLYQVGDAFQSRSSGGLNLSKSDWYRLPLYLLSREKTALGAWASREQNSLSFDASVASKPFMGFWQLSNSDKNKEVFELFAEQGGARLHSALGMSLGHWFLEENQVRIFWHTGASEGKEDVIRASANGFDAMRYAQSSSDWGLELVRTEQIVRLDEVVAQESIAQLSLGKTKRSKSKRQGNNGAKKLGKEAITSGYYSVVSLDLGHVHAYFQLLPGDKVNVFVPSRGEVGPDLAAETVARGSLSSVKRISDSLLIEWNSGYRELVYPRQRGFYIMESFAPGVFLDEPPAATFQLFPISEEAFRRVWDKNETGSSL